MAVGIGQGREARVRRFERGLAVARQEIRAGRFQRTMSLLAAISAIASGFEAYAQHERGAFRHWLMWTPVYLTPIATVVGVGGFFSKRLARLGLPAVAVASLLDGLIGFYYHLKGIRNLPGGFRLGQYNIVIGPPVFAPLLTGMVGVMALIASALRRERIDWIERGAVGRGARRQARRSGWLALLTAGEFQRGLSLAAALFAALAGGEAYFEHLRGSFNRRLMWTPVWLTPPMIAAGIAAAIDRRASHLLLPLISLATLVDGMLGFILHLQGIDRMPGGTRNLRFNVVMGPPLFAPLLFGAVGLLGLIATILRHGEGKGRA